MSAKIPKKAMIKQLLLKDRAAPRKTHMAQKTSNLHPISTASNKWTNAKKYNKSSQLEYYLATINNNGPTKSTSIGSKNGIGSITSKQHATSYSQV
jgi:hypothetical protein